MNEQQLEWVEAFLARVQKQPVHEEEVLGDGVEVDFAGDISGLVVWRDEVGKLFFYAGIAEPGGDRSSDFLLRYNLHWSSTRGAFCALDLTGEEYLLCRPLGPDEWTEAGLQSAWESVVQIVTEIREALDAVGDSAPDLAGKLPEKETMIGV